MTGLIPVRYTGDVVYMNQITTQVLNRRFITREK